MDAMGLILSRTFDQLELSELGQRVHLLFTETV